MDYFKLLPCLILLTIQCALTAHIPEVREDFENYNPTVFDFKEYQKATQQNPQVLRYKQQQQSDTYNIPISTSRQERYVKLPPYEQEAVKVPKQRDSWKVIHPKFVNENQRDDVPYESPTISNERITLEDIEEKSSTTPKSKITKKSLKPNSYEGKFNRKQDNNYLYENANGKKVYQQNVGGFGNQEQLKALNALLGQTPTIQLQGLQQLLGNRLKDHTPIKEDVVDIPNNQNKPNIKVQHNNNIENALQSLSKSGIRKNPDSLKDLQAQLDATANAHAESIIAQAQQKALEHVKAQHAAIARAQAEAEKQALLQVRAQNEALQRAQIEKQAEFEAEQSVKLLVEKDKEQRKIEERKRIAEIARERARASALAFKLKQERQKAEIKADTLQQDAHTVAQKTRNLNKQKKKVPHQDSSETQHYYTHQLPQQIQHAYSHVDPQIVHVDSKPHHHQNTKQNEHHDEAEVTKYYIPPQITTHEGKNEHGEHELQYAANYAFGYRIRDYHYGNDFGHEESKEGHTTKGHYHVLLPDGRIQNVEYYVDPSGYHAKVSYEGGSEEHH